MPAPYDPEYRREYYKREKARRLKLQQYLDNLPDDDSQLILDCANPASQAQCIENSID